MLITNSNTRLTTSSLLLLWGSTAVQSAALKRRATVTSAPVGSSYPVKTYVPPTNYTYPTPTDSGAPSVPTVAGLTPPGSPDVNPYTDYGRYESVLLLSLDGFHQYDLNYYMKNNPESTLAQLASNGLEFTNAKTSSPSDSFPGVQAFLTGSSPRTHGVYYDVAYDRGFYPPGSNCTGSPGTATAFDETIDSNSSSVTGGGSINASSLVLYKTAWGTCAPVYPWNYVRVNNIFEVARFNGLQTAYTDKHPAYTIARGPSGFGLSEGYFPEINEYSTQSEFESYDDLHWNALSQWTKGNHYNGSKWTDLNGKPPAIYGGNFQTYSVSEKGAGYNSDGSPSTNLEQAFQYLDNKLKALIQTMKDAGSYDKTLLIIFAKHGQSPIDRSKLRWVNPDSLVNATGVSVPGVSADDGAYLWLANPDDAPQAKANLLANKDALGIDQVWIWPELMANGFADPRYDSRAPDIVVKTQVGVIYTKGSAQKSAEHGGLNPDDVDVLLIVSNPQCISPAKNNIRISTRSIGPTVLKALGLNPLFLEGATKEATPVLPGVQY